MEVELTFRHFSHHHPLVRTNSVPARNSIACSGCNLSIIPGNDYYCCTICPFFLHKVCYNMPRKTRHPGHPGHYVNLLSMPSSGRGNLKCKACGQHVTGFCYNCAECGFCCHVLCSALPFSLAITSHSHSLKLEFYLPYYFECDICRKPCYNNGWLYRCRLCEFDSHLACAVMDQRAQSHNQLPTSARLPETLTRQIMYFSASLMEPGRKSIVYGSESNELMQLVAQGIAKGSKQESFNVAATGWDEKLYSPIRKQTIRNGKIECSVAFQMKPVDDRAAISPDLGGNIGHSDQVRMLSGDTSTLPSYQFSDSYFSIDLASSYRTNDQPNQESIHGLHKLVQDGREIISHKNDSLLERIAGNLELADHKQEISKPGHSFHYLKINEALLIGDGTDTTQKLSRQKLKRKNETRYRTGIKNQSSRPDTTAKSKCSCWRKLIQCCYYPGYERETVISKRVLL